MLVMYEQNMLIGMSSQSDIIMLFDLDTYLTSSLFSLDHTIALHLMKTAVEDGSSLVIQF